MCYCTDLKKAYRHSKLSSEDKNSNKAIYQSKQFSSAKRASDCDGNYTHFLHTKFRYVVGHFTLTRFTNIFFTWMINKRCVWNLVRKTVEAFSFMHNKKSIICKTADTNCLLDHAYSINRDDVKEKVINAIHGKNNLTCK